MLKFCMRHRGSISIMMAMLLLPMLILSGLIIDGSRLMSARTALAGAADLTMTSAMANYDEVLKDVYGVFAVSEDLDSLKNNLDTYFSNTINANLQGIGISSDQTTLNTIQEVMNSLSGADQSTNNGLMRLEDAEIDIAGVPGSEIISVQNGSVVSTAGLERQILEYMKYRAPVNLVMGTLDKFNLFKGVEKQNQAVTDEVDFEQSLSKVEKACQKLYEAGVEYQNALTETVDLSTPEKLNEEVYSRICRSIVALYEMAHYMILYNSDAVKNISRGKSNIEQLEIDMDFLKDYPEDDIDEWEDTQDFLQKINVISSQYTSCVQEIGSAHEIIQQLQYIHEVSYQEGIDSEWNQESVEEITSVDSAIYSKTKENAMQLFMNALCWTANRDIIADTKVKMENVNTAYNAIQDIQKWKEGVQNELDDITEAYGDQLEKYEMNDEDIGDTDEDLDAAKETKEALQKEANDATEPNEELDKALETASQIYELTDLKVRKTKYTDILENDIWDTLFSENNQQNYATAKNLVDTFADLEKTKFDAASTTNEVLGQYAEALLEKAKNEMKPLYTSAENLIDKAKQMQKQVKAVHNAVEAAQNKREKWQNSINAMDSGSIKSSMQGKYNETADDIDLSRVDAMGTVVDNLEKSAETLKTTITSLKFYSKTMVQNASIKGFATNFQNVKTFAGVDCTSLSVNGVSLSESELKQKAQEEFDAKIRVALQETSLQYEKPLGKQYTTDKAPNMNLWLHNTEEPNENPTQEFWRYLRRTFAAKAAQANQQKEKGNEAKKKITDKSKEKNTESADVSGNAVELAWNTDSKAAKQPETPDASDDDKAADTIKNNNNNIAALLSGLGNLAQAATTKLYLEEYMTEMFSCYTTNLKEPDRANLLTVSRNELSIDASPNDSVAQKEQLDTTLSGYLIWNVSNSSFYRAEQEYILWGKNTPKENVNNTLATIYGIRLMLNTTYALTSAEINKETLQIATWIAGWSGFGVPLVQAVLDIALAMAESGVDISILSKGGSVPFYKNNTTWYLSVSGLSKQAKDLVANVSENIVDRQIDSIYETLSNWNAGANDVLQSELSKFVTDSEASITDSAQSAIVMPLNQTIIKVLGDLSDDMSDKISELVDNTFDGKDGSTGISQTIELMTEGSPEQRYAQALYDELLANNCKQILKSKLQEAHDLLVQKADGLDTNDTAAVEAYQNTYQEQYDALVQLLDTLVQDAAQKESVRAVKADIESSGSDLQNQIQEYLNSGRDDAKEKASDLITKYTQSLSGASDAASDGAEAIDTTAGSGGIELNYQEYVKLLMMLFLAQDQNNTKMLARTAQLIQLNLNGSSQEKPFQRKTVSLLEETKFTNRYLSGDKIDLSRSFTMVSAQATANVKTLFMNITMGQHTDENGNTYYDYGWGTDDKKVNVAYTGVMGY